MNSKTKLKELYERNSKHSNYQILSDNLALVAGVDQSKVKSRYEEERLDYILKHVSVDRVNVLDIGGNTGFFTFEAIARGATSVRYYEGNEAHSEFVELASKVLKCEGRVQVENVYYSFGGVATRRYDVVFLMNVLHHLGDDYETGFSSIDAAKKEMVSQLNSMATITRYLILQLGFCWKGNRDAGLFEGGTKKEMVDFVSGAVGDIWEIESIGVPVRQPKGVVYVELDDNNMERDDSLGEFLNRPVFVLKSSRCTY